MTRWRTLEVLVLAVIPVAGAVLLDRDAAAQDALFAQVFAQTSAQTSFRAITGVVTDRSKAPLPGVKVAMSGDARGEIRTAVTNAQGRYRFESVLPGAYELLFVQPGFSTTTREVEVGGSSGANDAVILDVSLTVAMDEVVPAPGAARPRSRIVCGMTLIEGDPTVDPKITTDWRGRPGVDPNPPPTPSARRLPQAPPVPPGFPVPDSQAPGGDATPPATPPGTSPRADAPAPPQVKSTMRTLQPSMCW